ncbi:hypothetical protein CLM62_03840 [Streptomyces sp. SA15]|uniref:hypothetical protein n=1 Tax=Streptomyces sp. SA15 TaxID=934019 RepID=UPI000BB05872|nr:hypothetical protein [Streptomyces sp. SA15]PAZ17131.1 hypothetical protein CLM62_03840 [Streptomyces sp. SA15]
MADDSMMVEDGDGFVRRCIWEIVPESRDEIPRLEREELLLFGDGDGNVGMYTLITYAFVYPVLQPFLASESTDEAVAQRCARLIDALLASGRPSVRDMVSLRVTDELLGCPGYWKRFRPYAGPHLLAEVEERKVYYRDVDDEGV